MLFWLSILGVCPFLGVSNKVSTALGMAGAVVFVMVLATMVTYLIYTYVLIPLRYRFHADDNLHPCDCCSCADGRDHP
ncbi:MAG: hypothetical protein MZV63_30275 [Marinilabiliales bacterium]|nr:hypothetical protein [Marinilabiliales bacterium]